MAVTQQDRRDWTAHPVTQEFLKVILESRQLTMETWAKEGYTGATAEQSALMNTKALGGIDTLDKVLELIEGYKETETTTLHGKAHHDTDSY